MRGSNEEGEMEGGIGGNLLDPCALEFYPAGQFPAQIYYPYLPPPTAVAYHPHMQMQHALPGDEEPTRTVVLSLVPRHLDEASVAVAMEAFGAVRAVESEALSSEGTAAVHYYDIRSAVTAVYEIREQHIRSQGQLGRQYGVVPANWGIVEWPPFSDLLSPPASGGGRGLFAGQAVWAQFGARCVDGTNQGSLFVFNCDPTVPSAFFFQLFGSVGNVKEVKESAWKPHMRIIEFYDVRDAARAAAEFNGKEICGRRLLVKFTCAAGHSRRRSAGTHRSMAQPPRFLRTPPPAEQAEGQFSSPASSSSQRGAGRREEWVASDTGKKVAKNSNAAASTGGGVREDKRGKARQHRPEATAAAGPASSSSSSSSPTVAAAKQQLLSRRGWKNHPRNGGDSRFQFKEMAVEGSSSSTCRDSRTTVMIKNIPNKYSQKLLLRMLDNHCIRCNEEIREREDDDDDDDDEAAAAAAAEPFSAYDFVYLPIDFNNKCNVGYGFVNLTSPEAAMRLHRAFHMQPWEVFNSRKICQVNYARLQGLEALKEHFKNSKFACDTDEYMPVVFSPPRDGKELTEPVPVGGRGCVGLARLGLHLPRAPDTADYLKPQPSDAGGASSTTASTHAPSDTGVDDDRDDDDDEDGRGDGGGSGGDETVSRLSQALQLSYSSQG